MAYKGQILSDSEKQIYKDNYTSWKNTSDGIEYQKELEKQHKLLIEEYNKTPKLCKKCNSIIPFEKRNNNFCSRSCSASYNNCNRIVSQEQKNKTSQTFKTKVLNGTFIYPNNKKPTLYTKTCKLCGITFSVNSKYKHKKYCSKECYIKDPNKKGGKGGYRKGSGVGKHGWYKGFWCDSSYELAFVIYNIDHNIQFSRNKQGFEYEWNGTKHLYYPDFMIDDTYVEIKGFWTKQHEAKIKAFPHKLKILFKEDIKHILDYVIGKYGKDYLNLYEGNPYKEIKDNICKECGNPCKNVFCCQSCAGKHRARIKHSKQKS